MSRIVALTGATGFIGGALARSLAARGIRVRALVRGPRGARELPERVEAVPGALEDRDSLERLVRGVDAVVHCAGAVRAAEAAVFRAVNVDGVARLAAAAAPGRPRFLLVSSLAARAPSLSPYAASKRGGERALAAAAGRMPWTVLRPSAVYGPGDPGLGPLLAWLARGIAPAAGAREGRFSLVYVDDLAAAVEQWLERPGLPCGRVFELDDGRPGGYTWAEVAAAAARAFDRRVRVLRLPRTLLAPLAALNLGAGRLLGYAPMLTPGKLRELAHPDWVADGTALRRALDWSPRVALEEGLRRSVAAGGAPRGDRQGH